MDYLTWKWLHVLSSTLLFGTGIGTAFAMFYANRSGDIRAITIVARNVVRADWLFILPAAVFQPLSGYIMMQHAGIPPLTPWIWISFALYLLAGACWLPVVWLQIRMRDMAYEAAMTGAPMLSVRFWRCERAWVVLGVPAFSALVIVFYLMVVKPA